MHTPIPIFFLLFLFWFCQLPEWLIAFFSVVVVVVGWWFIFIIAGMRDLVVFSTTTFFRVWCVWCMFLSHNEKKNQKKTEKERERAFCLVVFFYFFIFIPYRINFGYFWCWDPFFYNFFPKAHTLFLSNFVSAKVKKTSLSPFYIWYKFVIRRRNKM